MNYTPERIAEILALADALKVAPLYGRGGVQCRKEYFWRHEAQMSQEGLHRAADIADELAHRDIIAHDLAAIVRQQAQEIEEHQASYRLRSHIYDNLKRERDELRAKLAACEQDAARYRWLRDSSRIPRGEIDGHIIVGDAGGEDVLWDKQLDAQIDAARNAK